MHLFQEKSAQPLLTYLIKKSNKHVTTECHLAAFPLEFGKEFILGAKIEDAAHSSIYYHVHFMDEIKDARGNVREAKYGILKVNTAGELSILHANFEPFDANSRFIFVNDNLALYGNEWLKTNPQVGNENRTCTVF